MPRPCVTYCIKGHEVATVGRNLSRQCRQCARDATCVWQQKNLSTRRLSARRRGILRRGLQPDDYERRVKEQLGLCAICRREPPIRYGERRLHIDHVHATGEVRGLLCQRCNLGIGQFQDSPRLLREAAAYLETHRAEKGLIQSDDRK